MTVYVQLLGEGTLVYRPTQAERVSENTVKLLPTGNYDPSDEEWEFPPGSIVRYEKKRLDVGDVWVAISLVAG